MPNLEKKKLFDTCDKSLVIVGNLSLEFVYIRGTN